jgi:cyanophycinase-like exopeptidase
MRQAYRDLLSAEKCSHDGDDGFASMLARQASEKALAAYYVKLHGTPPALGHSVSEMIRLMGLDELQFLLSGASEDASASEIRSVQTARSIIDWVEMKLALPHTTAAVASLI